MAGDSDCSREEGILINNTLSSSSPHIEDASALSFHIPPTGRHEARLRALLFAFLACVFCPIQYWGLNSNVDNTWLFGLNYGAAHHMVFGRDLVWTWGPLGYLAMPMDISNNLAKGLAFQIAVWALVVAVLWIVFFRSQLPLRNLVFFSVFLALSGAAAGIPEELVMAALILLVQFRTGSGLGRYIAALTMLGLASLITFTGLIVAIGILTGLLLERILRRGSGALRDMAIAACVPPMIAAAAWWFSVGSWRTLPAYIKSGVELSSGYNLAMSMWGPPSEFLAAIEVVLFLVIGLVVLPSRGYRATRFFALVLALPLFVNFKHGFVREDAHIIHFFCFVAIALGLVALTIALESQKAILMFTILTLLFVVIWQDNVARVSPRAALGVTGLRTVSRVWHAVRFGNLRRTLNAETQKSFQPDLRIEPEIRAIVGHQPVASLSTSYTNAYLEDLNLALYPVIQRYSAYTPYLDQLNADWVRDHGPPFLIFDGKSIDGRHPWTDTPAMWLETYRWYDTRLLGAHNLLLQRRSVPRFTRLEPVAGLRLRFGAELQMPKSQPVFWSMHCPLSTTGKLRQLLFRVLEVTMTVDKTDGRSDVFRVPLAVVGSPSPGNYLPSNLPEFASVFGEDKSHNFGVESLSFGGPGSSAYMAECRVEFLRPVR
jgi:hypothetical protein